MLIKLTKLGTNAYTAEIVRVDADGSTHSLYMSSRTTPLRAYRAAIAGLRLNLRPVVPQQALPHGLDMLTPRNFPRNGVAKSIKLEFATTGGET